MAKNETKTVKNMKEEKERILLDTSCFAYKEEDYKEFYLADFFPREEWKEFLTQHNFSEEEYSYEKYCEEKGAKTYEEWVSDSIYMDVEDFFDNCCGFFSEEKSDFVVYGRLGLWNGTHETGKVITDTTVLDVIRTCAESGDECQVVKKGKELYVTSSHHDGSNTLYIKELTRKGFAEYNKSDEPIWDLAGKLYNTKGLSKFVKVSV